ncbi:MAG: sugar ABC transporter permease [Clostridia bacterium]|nr:sugar ABC transporter permease [Clostridia bacterium]
MLKEKSTQSVGYEKKGGFFAAIRKNRIAWLLLLPSFYALFVVMWKPVFTGAYMSLFETQGYETVKFVGLANYIDVIKDPVFLETLINTFEYVLWSLVIGFCLPLAVAIALNEMVHFKSLFRTAVYLPVLVPMVASSLIWYFMYMPGPSGVLNMLLAKAGLPAGQWLQNPKLTILLIVISMTWKSFGATVVIYLASLQGISQDLYEAATIDGAGIIKRAMHITIPQVMPMALLMLVSQIISVFQTMNQPMIMTDGGPNNASMTLSLEAYYEAFRYMRADKSLAIGIISFLILLVMTVFYFRLQKKLEG